jgi:hypothetical protein
MRQSVRQTAALVALVAITGLVLAVPAGGDGPLVVNGGGAGTFAADLDGDGDIDGSRFGLGATIRSGGAAQGHFECLMAGDSDILGLHLMAVEGKVTTGSADVAGTATLGGLATVNLANGILFRGVPFTVQLKAGGPGSGALRLTVIGAFDGVPGDSVPGNGNYDLPWELVANGRIDVH